MPDWSSDVFGPCGICTSADHNTNYHEQHVRETAAKAKASLDEAANAATKAERDRFRAALERIADAQTNTTVGHDYVEPLRQTAREALGR